MRRMSCILALGATATVLGCSGPEAVGIAADVASSDNGKQVVVSPSVDTLLTEQAQQFSAQLLQDGKQHKAAFV